MTAVVAFANLEMEEKVTHLDGPFECKSNIHSRYHSAHPSSSSSYSLLLSRSLSSQSGSLHISLSAPNTQDGLAVPPSVLISTDLGAKYSRFTLNTEDWP